MRSPFPQLKDAQVIAQVIQGARPRRPTGDIRMQNYVWDLATCCWTKDPSLRPTADAIVEYLSNDGQWGSGAENRTKPSVPISRRVFVEKQEVVLDSPSFDPGHSSNPSTSSAISHASSPSFGSSNSAFIIHSPPFSMSNDSLFESFIRSPTSEFPLGYSPQFRLPHASSPSASDITSGYQVVSPPPQPVSA